MANIHDVFNVSGYTTKEACRIAIEQQAEDLAGFISGLKKRKSQVFAEIIAFNSISYDLIVTLCSLLLQVNLYCRRVRSTLLLKQLGILELVAAIEDYYTQKYERVMEYSTFIKELFICFV
jgi:hypothetical protein